MIDRRLGAHASEGGHLGEPEPRPVASSAVRPGPRRVLFALTELEYPTPALRRAAAMATAIDGDLYVLRVMSPQHPAAQRASAERHESLDEERACLARRGTIAWWRRTLLRPSADANIRVRIGDFVAEVSAHACSLSVVCVVLAPAQAGRAGTMTALGRACRQPVFATPDAGEEWAALLVAAKAADRG